MLKTCAHFAHLVEVCTTDGELTCFPSKSSSRTVRCCRPLGQAPFFLGAIDGAIALMNKSGVVAVLHLTLR